MKKISGTIIMTTILLGHVAARIFMQDSFTFSKGDYSEVSVTPITMNNAMSSNTAGAPVFSANLIKGSFSIHTNDFKFDMNN